MTISSSTFSTVAMRSRFVYVTMRILFRKLMPSYAVRSVAKESTGSASSDVFFICYWFQMIRIAAAAHSAKMVENEPFRDFTDEAFVGNDVRAPFCRYSAGAYQDLPVSVPVILAEPKPASVRIWSAENFSEQAINRGSRLGTFWHGMIHFTALVAQLPEVTA